MKLPQEYMKRIQNMTGAAVIDSEGERIGYIAGTLSVSESNISQNNPEYIVIGNDSLDAPSTKYYAVPAYTQLTEMSDPESIITAKFTKENMVRAKRISVDKCPTPFDYEPLIYELSDFSVPEKEGTDY